MAASNLYLKVPTQYEPSPIREIIQALCLQLDSLATGQTAARFSSLNVTPGGSVAPHAVSDIIYDLNATVGASLVPGLPLSYVRLGWIWNVAGNPGTFQELRVPTGALSISVPNNVVAASDGAGGFKFRTLTSADVPATTGLTGNTTVIAADVTLTSTVAYFDGPSQSVVAGVGTYFASGTVTILSPAGDAAMNVKLWDGTTVIASSRQICNNTATPTNVSLSGMIVSPAGNIRISVQDVSNTSGLIKANASSNSKDSSVTALRIA